ncbi:SpoIIE family protein phosphatase [Oceanobacillus senegalensis]|uniref:SpoIIE family protein phosphatase n=1 Tax=Oceanobacillus senegalensis TaxID=1936063 RepID=UPI000A30ED40|nr:SpoIIE family protein phosphatase [Oceanobacillus senegalensis]
MSTANNKVDVSVFQKPKKGNYYCGDSYFYAETENEFLCVIADGLGSGEYATESSQIVIQIIKENMNISVEELVKKANQQLYGKRGVVLGILKMDFSKKEYSFSSIGNIGVIQYTAEKKKRSIPNSGYLGGYERPFKVFKDTLEDNMTFIMFSDGVKDKELSKLYIKDKEVECITKSYVYISEDERKDDTTFIAIRYNGN